MQGRVGLLEIESGRGLLNEQREVMRVHDVMFVYMPASQ